MWKNYLKISFRNLWKRKLYTGINLIGLTVASVLAIGFGLWFSETWLQSLANKVSFSPWLYILTISVVLLLEGLTIGYRSWKVFWLNPAKTLKSE